MSRIYLRLTLILGLITELKKEVHDDESQQDKQRNQIHCLFILSEENLVYRDCWRLYYVTCIIFDGKIPFSNNLSVNHCFVSYR